MTELCVLSHQMKLGRAQNWAQPTSLPNSRLGYTAVSNFHVPIELLNQALCMQQASAEPYEFDPIQFHSPKHLKDWQFGLQSNFVPSKQSNVSHWFCWLPISITPFDRQVSHGVHVQECHTIRTQLSWCFCRWTVCNSRTTPHASGELPTRHI